MGHLTNNYLLGQAAVIWTGFIWPRIGTSGRALVNKVMNFGDS
jgi:hypothetical protein